MYLECNLLVEVYKTSGAYNGNALELHAWRMHDIRHVEDTWHPSRGGCVTFCQKDARHTSWAQDSSQSLSVLWTRQLSTWVVWCRPIHYTRIIWFHKIVGILRCEIDQKQTNYSNATCKTCPKYIFVKIENTILESFEGLTTAQKEVIIPLSLDYITKPFKINVPGRQQTIKIQPQTQPVDQGLYNI